MIRVLQVGLVQRQHAIRLYVTPSQQLPVWTGCLRFGSLPGPAQSQAWRAGKLWKNVNRQFASGRGFWFLFFLFFQVKASFNNVTRCYEITSVAGIKRYQQAFINYGSHDNQRLMLEYGFMAPCNPHSVVYVDSGELSSIYFWLYFTSLSILDY